jgi:hypothetical protein
VGRLPDGDVGTAWLPQIILLLGLAGGDPAPNAVSAGPLARRPEVSAGRCRVWLPIATTLALLTASFTTRRAYASVFLVGLFVILAPFTVGMAEEMPGRAGQWMSMFTLTNIPLHVNDLIFGRSVK